MNAEANTPYPAAVDSPRPSDPPRPHVVPAGTREFGMYLFLASLAVLFAASMVAYVIMRILISLNRGAGDEAIPGGLNEIDRVAPTVELGALSFPWPLFLSTPVILLASFTIHLAVKAVERERQARFRQMLTATVLLSGLFILIQTPAMIYLLLDRQEALSQGGLGGPLNALLFFLILLHALHVIGGIAPLLNITRNAYRGRYDHEHHGPVRSLAQYWHFLDLVWIVMFGIFLALR